MKRREVRLLLMSVLLMIFLMPGAASVSEAEEDLEMVLRETLKESPFAENEVIADGVFIDKIDVGGMTAKEAAEAVLAYVDEMGKRTLTVKLEGVDTPEIQVTAAELGLHTDGLSETILAALALGKGGNLISRYKTEKDLQVNNQLYELEMSIEEAQVERFVEERLSALDTEPVDAKLTRAGSGFSVSESKEGLEVDVSGTVSAVLEAFKDWKREDLVLTAKTQALKPKHTTEQLSQIQEELGTFSASTHDRSSGKLQNLQRGVDLTNGVLLMPGESWSMHSALAPFTAENGYTKQIAFQGNSYVQEYGGGVCQLATILYNAALRAEVHISKRFNHSMVVGYTDWGLDATINDDGSKDLELVNEFDFPIYIEAYHDGNGTVTYTIWGKETRAEGRTLKFTNEILSEEYVPDEVILDSSMAPGTPDEVVQATSYPKATVVAYKEIYEDGVLKERIELHTDHYLAKGRTIRRAPEAAAVPDPGQPGETGPEAGGVEPGGNETDPSGTTAEPGAGEAGSGGNAAEPGAGEAGSGGNAAEPGAGETGSGGGQQPESPGSGENPVIPEAPATPESPDTSEIES
ncbi:MAG: hypothetical protein HFI63_02340 [Lachnospiraceae bacterium]|nr:hypothetical protein [Lachnospiraceae bacterium]